MESLLWLVGGLLALVIGAVLSCLAQALRDLSRSTLSEIASIRNRPAATARVQRILEDVNGHAAAVALPRIVCNLVVTVCLVIWIRSLRGNPEHNQWWVEVGAGVAIASILLWVFGFLLPAAVSRHMGESTIYAWSALLRAMHVLTSPVRPLWGLVDEIVRRLSGRKEGESDDIEQELLSVVEDAQEEGKFDDVEREMIEAVVRFRNRTVTQVMTPRTEIHAMPMTNDLSVVTAAIRAIGHSRIPVYEGDVDHIVGIFYVKDLMRWLAGDANAGARSGRTFNFKSLLRPCIFVPESKTVRELLPELLGKRVHIAMVADEYGGTAGLVTIEDIVEEVFGEIQDEYEEPLASEVDIVIDKGARAAVIDARTSVEDANLALRDIDAEIPESEDYATVGGFVTVTLGRIPQTGERFSFDGEHAAQLLEAEVLEAEPTRVTKVRIAIAQRSGDEDASSNGAPSEAARTLPSEDAEAHASLRDGAK